MKKSIIFIVVILIVLLGIVILGGKNTEEPVMEEATETALILPNDQTFEINTDKSTISWTGKKENTDKMDRYRNNQSSGRKSYNFGRNNF